MWWVSNAASAVSPNNMNNVCAGGGSAMNMSLWAALINATGRPMMLVCPHSSPDRETKCQFFLLAFGRRTATTSLHGGVQGQHQPPSVTRTCGGRAETFQLRSATSWVKHMQPSEPTMSARQAHGDRSLSHGLVAGYVSPGSF